MSTSNFGKWPQVLLGLCLCLAQAANALAQEVVEGTTDSGFAYVITKGDSGIALDSGMIALVDMRQLVITGADTISDKSAGTLMPIRMAAPKDPVMEVLRKMDKGDRATMEGAIAKLVPEVPPHIPDSAIVAFHIRVEEAFENELAYKGYVGELENQRRDEEEKEIVAYIAERGWEAKKTESGLYYVVTQEGAGELPKSGDRISVHYTGTLTDGEEFDSSVRRGQPFTFNVGKGRVIQGWDEGFQLFKPGGKGFLIIPSHLGYGPRGAGNAIPPNAVLIFEIEFLENLGQ